MRLPIRNKTDRPLHIFIEPWCDDYELLPGGEAFVHLGDGLPHSFDVYDGQVTIWNEGNDPATVEVVPEEGHSVAEALQLARVWLCQLGAKDAADEMADALQRLEGSEGYLKARARVFATFHGGFRAKEAERKPGSPVLPLWPGEGSLAAAWIAGGAAAWLNRRARRRFAFPGWGKGPLDTDHARESFARAMAVIGGMEGLGKVDSGSSPE